MNAVGYAHYQLNGGTRRLVRWVILVGVLAAVWLMVGARSGGGIAAAAAGLRFPASIALGVLLVIFCNIRIAAAVRRDATLDMLRSHRLMPQPTSSAIVGYIVGPALPVLAAAGVVVLIGSTCMVIGGGNPATWLTVTLILTVFAAMTWCFTVAGSLGPKPDKKNRGGGGIGWIPWALIGPAFGSGGLIFVVAPFVAVLLGPLSGRTIFAIRRPDQITWAHLVSGAMHVALAGVFFAGACRRYRRDDVPVLSAPLWLVLVALVVIGSILGIEYFDAFRPGFYSELPSHAATAMPGTLTLLLLLLAAPLLASEWESAAWQLRRRAEDPFAHESRPALLSWQTLGLFVVLCIPLGVVQPDAPGATVEGALRPVSDVWLLTACSFLSGAVLIWALVRVMQKRNAGGSYAFWFVFLLWDLPVMAAAGWSLHKSGSMTGIFNPFISFSTPGAFAAAWNGLLPSAGGAHPWNLEQRPASVFWPGVAFQALIAGSAVVAAWRIPDRSADLATRD